MAIHKKTQITIDVDLDENNIPEHSELYRIQMPVKQP